jgi:ribosome maturation factor RimP
LSQKIADRAREIALPLAAGMGFEVVDVAYARENSEWNLCVYIDKRGGIHIDDCERLSKELSVAFDAEPIFDRAYNLIVSSPGLDRPLKTVADFIRYEGALLDIDMLPGRLITGVREEAPAETEDSGKAEDMARTGSTDKLDAKARTKNSEKPEDIGRTGGPKKAEDMAQAGSTDKPDAKARAKNSEKPDVRAKIRTQTAVGQDKISGILIKLEEGRVYLSDGRDGVFSLAREDIKTVKRAVRFK